jgi:hypothetical protein
MRRNVVVLALTLALGIAVGVIGERVLSAQPAPVNSTDIFKADVVGVEGKEGIVQFVELLPRGASGIHYHPAHTFVYVMEGTLTVESEGASADDLQGRRGFSRSARERARGQESHRRSSEARGLSCPPEGPAHHSEENGPALRELALSVPVHPRASGVALGARAALWVTTTRRRPLRPGGRLFPEPAPPLDPLPGPA